MKLKIFLHLCFLLLLVSTRIYSQQKASTNSKVQISVNWGTKYKNPKDEFIRNILLDDGQNIYATIIKSEAKFSLIGSKSNVTPSLVKYNDKMELIKRRDYTTNEKDLFYHGTFNFADGFIIFSSKINKATKAKELYAQRLNTDFDPVGKSVTLWEVVGQKGQAVDFGFNMSPDKNKLCIYLYTDQDKKLNENFNYKIFDKELNSIYERKVTIDAPFKQVIALDAELNNKGEFFQLVKIYNDEKNTVEIETASGKIPGYRLLLTKYSQSDEKIFNFDLKGKFRYSEMVDLDKQGNYRLFISYEDVYDKGINGFMYYKFDCTTGNILSSSDIRIDETLAKRIVDMQDDKQKSPKPAISTFFGFSDIYFCEDGSMFIMFEKNYNYEDRGTTYCSKGIIVYKLDSLGQKKWVSYIPKDQEYTSYSGNLYHKTIRFKNKIYVLYNDSKDNEQYDIVNSKKPPKKYKSAYDVNLMMVEFDDNGNMSRKKISTSDEMGTNINMEKSKQLTDSRVVLYGISFKNGFIDIQTKLGIADLTQ